MWVISLVSGDAPVVGVEPPVVGVEPVFELVLVDLDGFEPSTSSMPWKRAPNCATGPRDKV